MFQNSGLGQVAFKSIQRSRTLNFPGGPVVMPLPSNAGDTGLIPGWRTKILHATQCGKKKKKSFELKKKKKQDFALNWKFGSRDNSMVESFNNSYLEDVAGGEQSETNASIDVCKLQSFLLARVSGSFGHFRSFTLFFLYLVFRSDYGKVVLSLPRFFSVAGYPYLMLVLCEHVHIVQEKN